jgi:hypothetical protein
MAPLMETKNKGINCLDTLAALAQVILFLEMLKFFQKYFISKDNFFL